MKSKEEINDLAEIHANQEMEVSYDTRKSDNKYTEEDMKKAFKFYAYAHISQQPHSYEKLEQDYLQFIQSLNKQI